MSFKKSLDSAPKFRYYIMNVQLIKGYSMPRLIDHDAYRTELLRSSLDVAAKVGYGSLSMKQLAKQLNISTGSIYHYFINKENWFMMLVAFSSKETFEMLNREIQTEVNLEDKCEQLLAHIEKNINLYTNMLIIASDYARLRNHENPNSKLEFSDAIESIIDHMSKLFKVDLHTAKSLAVYSAGLILANHLNPKPDDAQSHLVSIRLLLNAYLPISKRSLQNENTHCTSR